MPCKGPLYGTRRIFHSKKKRKIPEKGERRWNTGKRYPRRSFSVCRGIIEISRAESRRRAAHLLARTGGTNGTDRVTDQAGFQLLRRLRSAGLWLQHRKAPGGAGRHSGTACGTHGDPARRRQLGRALLNNFNFSASGFELLCAFDANPDLIGRSFRPARGQGRQASWTPTSRSTTRTWRC